MKVAIRVHTEEQSEFVQKLAFKARYGWTCGGSEYFDGVECGWCIIFDDSKDMLQYSYDNCLKKGYTVLDFAKNMPEILEFFKKPQPQICPECGGDLEGLCDHFGLRKKEESKKKVPFEEIGFPKNKVKWTNRGITFDWGGIEFSKENIRQAAEYYDLIPRYNIVKLLNPITDIKHYTKEYLLNLLTLPEIEQLYIDSMEDKPFAEEEAIGGKVEMLCRTIDRVGFCLHDKVGSHDFVTIMNSNTRSLLRFCARFLKQYDDK